MYSPRQSLAAPGATFSFADAFWQPIRTRLVEATLPRQWELLVERGRLDDFRRASGLLPGPTQGLYSFDDTDVYKWLEAASSCLASFPPFATAGLARQIDEAIDLVAAAQEPDGYLNTYYTGERCEKRWTSSESHELYTAGHLIQAAIAHHRATGSEKLLSVAVRFADLLYAKGSDFLDSHPQIELALAQLARVTENRAYLILAQAHLDARGRGRFGKPYRYFEPDYAQDHVPYRELDRVVGHAVRMLYLAIGAAEICLDTGERALLDVQERQWENMTSARSYVTGGIGSRHDGEAFGRDYELPSATAYAETCAAIASVQWNERLLALTGKARYADALERALYNAALVGISLDGTRYFYDNPLESDGSHVRQPWFDCACCPPNVARLLGQIPRFVASMTSGGALRMTLWIAGDGTARLPGGSTVLWSVATQAPWDGDVTVTLTEAPTEKFALELRVPEWTEAPTLAVNDALLPAPEPGTFARVERVWSAGDRIRLTLPMPVRKLVGHPRLADSAGRVALQRGPLIYAVEAADHPEIDLHALRLTPETELKPVFRPELLGGVVVLEGRAALADLASWSGTLYRTAGEETPSRRQAPLVAVPYYAWANRTPGDMLVWIPTE